MLLPVHIVFLELIIDPACSLIFEAEGAEKDIMLRPPREPGERLFNARVLGISLLQGSFALAFILLMFWVAGLLGQPQDDSRRSFVFATLVFANLALIMTNRSWSRTIITMLKEPNAVLWWILGGATVMLALVLYVPALRSLLHLNALQPKDLGLCLLTGMASVGWFEVYKLLRGNIQPPAAVPLSSQGS